MAQQTIFRFAGLACGAFALAGCAQTPVQTGQIAAPALPVSAQALVGSTPAILNADFGQPVLLRMDGTAQVWLYHSSVCGLNLILYPDGAGVPRVAAAVPDNGDAQSCVISLEHSLTDAANRPALERPASS